MKGSVERWDLIVAGGGPAGCALAAKAASDGARVLLLERESEPGDGRGWVVDVESTAFAEADVPEPEPEARWPEVERAVLKSPVSGFEVDLLPSPTVGVRNDVYVRQLAGWAASSGTEIRTGCRVKEPLMSEGAVTGVSYEREGVEVLAAAPLVADCTGIRGTLRLQTPASWGLDRSVTPRDTVLARRDLRRIDAEDVSRFIAEGLVKDRVLVERVSVHGGYSVENMYLDSEKQSIDILIGAKPDPDLPTPDDSFERIEHEYSFTGVKIFGDGGAIPIGRTLDSLVGDGLLVLGDSACQVIPIHGSGTASALIAAEMASKAVSRSLLAGRYDRSALWEYCHGFQSGRGAMLAYYYVVRLHSDKLSSADVDEMIRRGVLSPREVYSGTVPEPFKPGPRALAEKIFKGISILPLLLGFAKAGLKAQKMMKHYQNYPVRYDAEAFDSWVSGIPVP